MPGNAASTDQTEQLISLLEQGQSTNNTKKNALARLRRTGLPGKRDEYWKFTDPTPLTSAENSVGGDTLTEQAEVFETIDRIRLVFVDGVYDTAKSDAHDISGLEISPLSTAIAQENHWANSVFGQLEEAGQTPVSRPLATLNTAFAQCGVVIRASGKISTPVEIRYLGSFNPEHMLIHNLIKLDANAELTVLESGTPGLHYNTCAEVDIADNAAFNHVRTQGNDTDRQCATHMFARLRNESSLKSFTLSANGKLTRNECVIELTGDDASAHVAGAAIGDAAYHHDDTVFLTHDGLNCESRQVFKKVLRDGAVGVFQGKILVKEGAQKTDGYQISKGLMLDDNSQFLAKPELEIYADDVACSHGSTVGTLDEEALFYLTSRGVSKKDAQDMLVLAFMDEAIQEIEDPDVAEVIRTRLAVWAGSELG